MRGCIAGHKYVEQTNYNSAAFDLGVLSTHGYFDVDSFLKIHNGEAVAYLARGVFPVENCSRIAKAFVKRADRHQYDVKPVIEALGKPLFRAELPRRNEYFSNASKFQAQIQELFVDADTPNFVETLVEKIRRELRERSVETRPIEFEGRNGFYGITRRWGAYGTDSEGNSTRIHEDRTQLRNHEGLETRQAANGPLVSTCIYYSNGERGGGTTIFNIRPSFADSQQEQVEGEYGYGYDKKWVAGLSRLDILPQAGDVLTFSADFLHVVNGIEGGDRINSSFFSSMVKAEHANLLVWS